jgi:hypothetical protein
LTLRRFAFWNIVFWTAQQPLVIVWYFTAHDSFVNGAGLLYLSSISVAALWLSSLSWWQSTRVEDSALTIVDLVENTNLEPTQET